MMESLPPHRDQIRSTSKHGEWKESREKNENDL